MVLVAPPAVRAQSSVSISWDLLPYQEFDELIIDESGGTPDTLDNPQTRLGKTSLTLTYPIVRDEGNTVWINSLSLQYINFQYKNFNNPLSELYSAGYTLMLQRTLSEKWSLWGLATPSLASDLRADISKKDFNFQTAVIFVRQYSEKLSIGYGAAYSTQFGSAIPLPVLAFDWNNGKSLLVKGIVPVSLELWYRYKPKVDIGLLLAGDGNNFRGDPAVYEVTDPELRYTMLTFGPAAKMRLSAKGLLSVEVGLIALHRFEFYDGDTESASFDLKPSQYIRFGFQYGG